MTTHYEYRINGKMKRFGTYRECIKYAMHHMRFFKRHAVFTKLLNYSGVIVDNYDVIRATMSKDKDGNITLKCGRNGKTIYSI